MARSQGQADEIGEVVNALNPSLTAWGLPTISEVGQGGLREGAIDVASVRQMSTAQLRYSIGRGYLRQRIGCQDAGGEAAAERVLLIAFANGVTDTNVSDEIGAATLDTVRGQLDAAAESPSDVGSWYVEGLSRIGCVPGT